jgi:hypothetical protein
MLHRDQLSRAAACESGLPVAISRDSSCGCMPTIGLKHFFQWRVGDAACVVGDGGCGDDADNLQKVILAETGVEECRHILIVEMPTLFDECPCKGGQGRMLRIRGSAPFANGVDIRRVNTFFHRQEGMECHRPGRRIGDSIGKQDNLNLLFGKAAAMNFAEESDQAPTRFGMMPNVLSSVSRDGLDCSGADSMV